jgi:sarcosine oxidase subunit beta
VSTASTVIVGGGVIGASVAWHLAARGVKDALVLDRAAGVGFGSTAAATGGYRAQFATAINVRLSLLSREKLLRFRDEIGADPGYVPAGYLWIAEDDSALAALSAARQVQHREGLREAVEVGPDEIGRLQPAIALEGIVGGAYCPTDGYIRPRSIQEGYLRAAERLGMRFSWGDAVTGFDRDPAGRIVAVRTTRDRVSCTSVVNAAGAWARELAALSGVDLPVVPLRRQMASTIPTRAIASDAPMTLYGRDGFHFRERDGRVILSWPTPGNPEDPFDTRVQPEWLSGVASLKDARVPALRGVRLDPAASWAGLYEMSPDRHAILGPAATAPNFYFINGSSGHGVMHAPALGHLLAEIMVDGRASTLDAAPLAAERFTTGRSFAASEVL